MWWTYAYTWTVGAQDTDLEAIDNLVEVFGLGRERGLGVELLGNGRVGLGGDLLFLELLGHVDSSAVGERSSCKCSKGWLRASLDRDAWCKRCKSTSGREHCSGNGGR